MAFENEKIEDLYGFSILFPLLVGFPYLPFTGAAMRPLGLSHILNDILINGRRRIIEFGSGISTILMARLIKANKLDVEVLSIEHDAAWADRLGEILASEGAGETIHVVRAPLSPCVHAVEGNEWYDWAVLERETAGKTFDMAIVDGPPARQPEKSMARYPALPFVLDKMKEPFSIYLDDADRPGEQAILAKWTDDSSLTFDTRHRTFAFVRNGKAFFTAPFAYYGPPPSGAGGP